MRQADNTFALVAKANYLMNTYIEKELQKRGILGLASSHGSIIFALYENDEITMSELSKKINKTPQTVTTLVSKLIKLGYVETVKSEIDKRTTYVMLTQEGKLLFPIILEISGNLYELQYQGMSDDHIDILRSQLEKLIQNLTE